MTSRSAAYTLYSGSHAFVDGVETVTYTPANPTGAAVADVKALRGDLQQQPLTGNVVQFEPAAVEFVLWDATLAGSTPAGGDLITDESNSRFRVTSVVRQMWDTQWKCICQPEV